MFNGKAIMTQYSETKMYGMTEAQIRAQYMNSLTAKFSGLEMVVMGILSDCQELSTFKHEQASDQIRKNLNIAKFILCEMMDDRLLADNAKKVHHVKVKESV